MWDARAFVVAAAGCALLAGCSGSSSGGAAPAPSSPPSSAGARPIPTLTPGSRTSEVATVPLSRAVITNVNDLADSEVVYFRTSGRYTANLQELVDGGGYVAEPGAEGDPAWVGIDGTVGFCIVSAATSAGPWALYDPHRGGVATVGIKTRSDAEEACRDPGVTTFERIR